MSFKKPSWSSTFSVPSVMCVSFFIGSFLFLSLSLLHHDGILPFCAIQFEKKKGEKGKKKCFSYFANEPHNTWKCFFSQRRRHLSPVGYFIRNGGEAEGEKNKVTHASSSSSSSSWSRTCGGGEKERENKKKIGIGRQWRNAEMNTMRRRRGCVCVCWEFCASRLLLLLYTDQYRNSGVV